MIPRISPTSPATRAIGNRRKETAATRLATPMTNAATPRPFRGRAVDGGAGGCGAYDGSLVLISCLLSERPGVGDCNAIVAISGRARMQVGRAGIEPATRGLRALFRPYRPPAETAQSGRWPALLSTRRYPPFPIISRYLTGP